MAPQLSKRISRLAKLSAAALLAVLASLTACRAPSGALLSVAPAAGKEVDEGGQVALAFSDAVVQSHLTALIAPIGLFGPEAGRADGNMVTFSFNAPTVPIPVTVSVVGEVRLRNGARVAVKNTWSFDHTPRGVDFPLPPAPVVSNGTTERLLFFLDRAALRASPDATDPTGEYVEAGSLAPLIGERPELFQIGLAAPPDLPTFRDRSGKIVPPQPSVTGWVPAKSAFVLPRPNLPDITYTSYVPWRSLVVLFRGVHLGFYTVRGPLSEENLLPAEGEAYITLIGLYGAPFAANTRLSLTEDELATFSDALDTHYAKVLSLLKVEQLGRLNVEGRLESLMAVSREVNRAFLGLGRPGGASTVPLRVAALLKPLASKEQGDVPSDAMVIPFASQVYNDQLQEIRESLLVPVSDWIVPTSIPD